MKKTLITTIALGALIASTTVSCGISKNTIKVAASETPHAQVLRSEAVQNALSKKGYTLKVTVLDWTQQNSAVENGDYDANYFQHRQYLQTWEGNTTYSESYEYKKLFPVVAVHSEPLRIYKNKDRNVALDKNATFEICSDPSNAVRALDLLKSENLIDGYELDVSGNIVLENGKPKGAQNVTLIDESLLAAGLSSVDYGVLPVNTALTGNIDIDENLPVESQEDREYRANVLAASVTRYAGDQEYKAKIDALADVLVSSVTSDVLLSLYSGKIVATPVDYRTSK